jgi:hypothetical protein
VAGFFLETATFLAAGFFLTAFLAGLGEFFFFLAGMGK